MENGVQIGYKVLTPEGFSSSSPRGLTYGDFWTSPREGDGPLAVFNTYTAAAFFASGRNDVVKECVYIEETKEKKLWILYKGCYKVLNYYDTPHGTRLARAVHLLPKGE